MSVAGTWRNVSLRDVIEKALIVRDDNEAAFTIAHGIDAIGNYLKGVDVQTGDLELPGERHRKRQPDIAETDDDDEMRMIGHMARINPHAGALRSGDKALAVKAAGYKSSAAITKVMDRPAVQAAVRDRELAMLHNELLPLANGVLRQALTDGAVPWGAKMKAVDIVHKRVFGDQETGSGKTPSEMSPDELGQALDKLKRELSDRATLVLEAEPAKEEHIPNSSVFE